MNLKSQSEMQADCSISPGFSSPSCCPGLPLCSYHPLESLPEMRPFSTACTAALLELYLGPSDFLIPAGRSQALQSNCCPGGKKITCSFSFTEHAQSCLHQNMSCHNSNNLLGDLHSSHSQASHLSLQVIRAGTRILIPIY